jgi:hypothetical protein
LLKSSDMAKLKRANLDQCTKLEIDLEAVRSELIQKEEDHRKYKAKAQLAIQHVRFQTNLSDLYEHGMIIDTLYDFLQARKASRQMMDPMTSEEFIDFAEEQQMAVKLLRDLKVKHQQLQNDHNAVVRDKAALETELRLEMKSKVFFFLQYIWIHFLPC